MTAKSDGKILVTGAGGLIAARLIELLVQRGYSVVRLSHSRPTDKDAGIFHWNTDTMKFDPGALEGVTHIINLAGAGIADKRWSDKRKKEIINSRVASASLLFNSMQKEATRVNCYITASAIGIYGNGTSAKIFAENDPPADDFLAEACRLWEEGADQFQGSGIRAVKIRTGIVLSGEGGFLRRISLPASFGLFAWFGTGDQFLPWIHIDDLCDVYIRAIEDEKYLGTYNAVAPQHITQKDFMKTYAKIKGTPTLKAGIPSFLVRLALGELSGMLLNGSRVSNGALKLAGYGYRYPTVEEALKEILGHR